MGINRSLAKEAEALAKRLAKKLYGSEGMWELCLGEAYEAINHTESMKLKDTPKETTNG